jgi:hypothetical protein
MGSTKILGDKEKDKVIYREREIHRKSIRRREKQRKNELLWKRNTKRDNAEKERYRKREIR